MTSRWFALCGLVALHSPLSAQRPSPAGAEPALVRFIDIHNAEAEALLERIVNINSGTLNLAGVREVGRVLRAELDALSFTTRWEDGGPFKRAGHLVAEHNGKGTRLLLIGHLDTVFEEDSPFQRFERIDATTARGPGIIDMKGGDVIIVQALKALKAAGLLDNMNVTVIMTGDEEAPGEPRELARRSLLLAAKRSDVAIGFEDGSGDPRKAVIARRGYTSWTLRVTGTAAHSSQIFREEFGPGAVFETARILNGFRERLAGQQYLTFSPGIALGGTTVGLDSTGTRGTAFGKDNIIAEHMLAKGDLRILSPAQLAETKSIMQSIAAQSLPHTSAVLTFDDGYPPLPPTDGNRRLLSIYDQVSRDLGFDSVAATDPMRAGAADVSFTSGIVPMAIDGIGLAGHDDHTAKETADLSALPMLTKRAAVLFYRLTRGPIP
ncbi:MAG: M20/M25/M40 family metallo-hydrolase [Gemmatimonadota bacterium]